MANPTPTPIDKLISAGEDLCNGLEELETPVGMKQNTFALTRADLDALIAASQAFDDASGEQPDATKALQIADSNGKAFIGAVIKVLSISLGSDWSDAWMATGLPNNTVGIPTTQDARFTALGSLKAYFTAHPEMEVSTPKVTVTAARAGTLHQAISAAREGVGKAMKKTADKKQLREPAEAQFRKRYRQVIGELEGLLEEDDPRWYQFGLNRPADPATPGVPFNVTATPLGNGRVLAQLDISRRANSHNFYKKIVGTDAEPVKVINTGGTQHTIEGLPVGSTVEITVTGVNDAGEGQPSEPVTVVVT